MTRPALAGRPESAFAITVRVYFQDTDAGGIVYHARYLDFFERCRMDWLRARGMPVGELASAHGVLFIVRGLDVAYRRPARLDDELSVTLDVEDARGAVLALRQTVARGAELLVEARVQLACVTATELRPTRLPARLRDLLLPSDPIHPPATCP